ncbi:MAG: hypothetical protein ACLQK4_13715 [Acidimicrobiales bacterium]
MPRLTVIVALSLSCVLTGCARSSQGSRPHERARPVIEFPAPVPTVEPPSTTGEVEAAWVGSERAFYAAGRLGRPDYAPLTESFAPGSPALAQTTDWLMALSDAGVIAPTSYRVGNARVTTMTATTAVLTGCTYDTGSIYRSSGAPAPAGLGGGAGLTASIVTLHRVAGRWLVWSDQTSTPSSSKENGPCQGF